MVTGDEVVHAGQVPMLSRLARRPDAPLVVLYHGFGAPGSIQAMAEAFPLSGLSAHLAYVGLPLFGERLPAGGVEEIVARQSRDYLRELLMPVIDQAVDELPAVVAAVTERAEATPRAVALLGFSAGGALATGWLFMLQGPVLPLAAVAARRCRLWRQVRPHLAVGLTGGVLSLTAYALVLWAQTRGALAPIAALRETSVIIGAVIGAVFFHERFGRWRIAATVLVAAGVILINL